MQVGFIETPTTPHHVESRVVGWDELAVLVPPGHPWTRRRTPVTADELARERLIVHAVLDGPGLPKADLPAGPPALTEG